MVHGLVSEITLGSTKLVTVYGLGSGLHTLMQLGPPRVVGHRCHIDCRHAVVFRTSVFDPGVVARIHTTFM